jgi:hypothetical protein
MKFDNSKLNREWLLRYVLGELPEQETQSADTRFVTDDMFASTVDGLYRDLLDAYAADEVSGREKERTERAFFAEPHQVHQLKVLQAIRSASPRVPLGARGVSRPWFVSFWPVAATVGVVSLAIWVALHEYTVKLRAPATRNIPADVGVSAKVPQTPATLPSAQTPAPRESLYTILLLPNVSRGNGAAQSFPVPSSTQKMLFQIVLPDNQAGATFEVRLMGSKKHATNLYSGLAAQTIKAQKYLEFRVPAAELPADNYQLDVFASIESKHAVEHFVVHIVRTAPPSE